MYHFSNLAEAEKALEAYLPSRLPRPAYTLDHIVQFMDFIGNPQELPQVIHIAGTSGKTSTAYYAAALLKGAGKRAGLLVSPHVMSITERVQIDLEPLNAAVFCSELAVFLNLVDKSGLTLSYAEILYAFAYWEFVRQKVKYVVVETGLGGLLDATNVVENPNKICIITDIGLDHTNILGTTLPEIAAQKAGIIKLRNTVFCFKQSDEIMKVFFATCRQKQADLHIVDQDYPAATRHLPTFQQRNYTLALRTVEFMLGRNSDERQILEDSDAYDVHIPGRMEVLHKGTKTIILDGAHNPQKLQSLFDSICEKYPKDDLAVLIASIDSGGRNLKDLLAVIKPYVSHVIATSGKDIEGSFHKWQPTSDIIKAANEVGIVSCEGIEQYDKALEKLLARPEQVIVVTGSLYIYKPVRSLL